MRTLGAVAILGLLAGAWAQVLPNIRRPPCDSPEVEQAALIAQDYINSHHKHGYKFILNQIDEIKIIEKPDGGETYLMEVDLLETTCHVLDPTPLANCSVREKHLMHVDSDCDVALTKEKDVLTVKAYKCKTKPDSREQMCLGCIDMVHLNHTEGLDLVTESLIAYNTKSSDNPDQARFALLEVTRLSAQVVGGGHRYFAEFAIVETNCTVNEKESCVFLNHTVARHGFCVAKTVGNDVDVDCNIFENVPNAPHHLHHHEHHHLHHHQHGPHGVRHHHLKQHHDPDATGLLSESKESAEVPKVKRETVGIPQAPTHAPVGPVEALVPHCPGKVKFY
ncbi:alpha-2-HS-glycoprotein 2 [Scleropages formosus]|uniref:alpha-2-HS-glycoprotein 2 n=1 Tax=Scleropages formosus TaxID=113540 RepID=UPI0008786D10|nr:alpha-2-HS-glycoprotein-like [Scleropages formosus]